MNRFFDPEIRLRKEAEKQISSILEKWLFPHNIRFRLNPRFTYNGRLYSVYQRGSSIHYKLDGSFSANRKILCGAHGWFLTSVGKVVVIPLRFNLDVEDFSVGSLSFSEDTLLLEIQERSGEMIQADSLIGFFPLIPKKDKPSLRGALSLVSVQGQGELSCLDF